MRPGAAELRAKLTTERERLMEALAGVDGELAARRFEGTDGWTSIHDTLRHVASAEASMMIVAARTVDGTFKPVEGFDLNRFNARQVEKRASLSWDDSLDELQTVRTKTLNLLDEWTDEQLAMPTVHPVWGDTTVGGLFRIIAIHDTLHRKDVETLKAAFSEPQTT
jgi:hypothetical protein